MATVFKTSEEWADALSRPRSYDGGAAAGATTEPDNAPTAPATLESPSSSTPAPKAQAAPAGQTQAPATNPYQTYTPKVQGSGPAPTIGIREYAANPNISPKYSDLFKPLTGTVEKATKGLKGTTDAFSQAVGPKRTYEGIGAEGFLSKALTPDQDAAREKESFDLAKSLVDARFEGPSTLDQDTLDQLYGLRGQAQSQARPLGTSVGVQALIRKRTPGLSPGESRFESQRLLKDPAYRAAERAARQDVGQLSGQLQFGEEEAARLGQEATEAEEDIAERSRGYLEGRQEAITSELDQKIKDEEAYTQALLDAYNKFNETGSVEDLAKIEGAKEAGVEKIQADPIRDLHARGQAKLDEINEAFKDIEDIPLLAASVNDHGRWTAKLPQEWLESDEGLAYSPEQLAQITARAQQRQQALADAGFGNFEDSGWNEEAAKAVFASGHAGRRGEFADIFPMYDFGAEGVENFAPSDLRLYADLTDGVAATRSSLATDEQGYTLNRSAALMDLSDMIDTAADKHERQKLALEADRLLSEEIAWLEASGDKLDEGGKAYLQMVHDARKDVRRARRRKKWTKVVRILSSVALGGLPELGRILPVSDKVHKELDTGTGKLLAGG